MVNLKYFCASNRRKAQNNLDSTFRNKNRDCLQLISQFAFLLVCNSFVLVLSSDSEENNNDRPKSDRLQFFIPDSVAMFSRRVIEDSPSLSTDHPATGPADDSNGNSLPSSSLTSNSNHPQRALLKISMSMSMSTSKPSLLPNLFREDESLLTNWEHVYHVRLKRSSIQAENRNRSIKHSKDDSGSGGKLAGGATRALSSDSINFKNIFSNNSFESYLTDDKNGSRLNYSIYFESNNETANGTWSEDEPWSERILMGVTSVVLGVMILITVIGNVFVIVAILIERNLQNVANYLIVSLAVADLMVACLVMPLGAVYEISRGWILGPELCDMWTSSDVLCCTASILHLVAIALDRYWAVTNVDYIHTRNGSRIVTMIVIVWSVAVIVSLAPQFGWKDPEYLDRINQQTCLVSQDIGYQIFATCSTFYVPLLVILVLYWKIFQTARKRIRRRREQRHALVGSSCPSDPNSASTPSNQSKFSFITKRRFIRITRYGKSSKSSSKSEGVNPDVSSSLVLVEGHSSCSVNEGLKDSPEDTKVITNCESDHMSRCQSPEVTTVFTIRNHTLSMENNLNMSNPQDGGGGSPDKPTVDPISNNGSASHQSDSSKISVVTVKDCSAGVETLVKAAEQKLVTSAQAISSKSHPKKEHKRESLEAKRERKAAKTLAIITGAFVVCWLPFFLMALLMPLCASCSISKPVASVFLWLGYFNSTLNPVIYTIFNPEFRQAFKRILCGKTRNSRGRLR